MIEGWPINEMWNPKHEPWSMKMRGETGVKLEQRCECGFPCFDNHAMATILRESCMKCI